MNGGLRLPRFFGFEVRLDPSWFLIFLLVLWTFAEAVFPRRVPGFGTGAYTAMALAGAFLFFGSVLLHELAHSAVARALGIPVEGITLFVFGGMARIRSEASTPRDEFLITVVGPLSSAAVGFLLLGVAALADSAALHPAVAGVAGYLALLNFILAGFNLIPGFPLDGGRLFRSVVWHITGDLRKATRWASLTGRIFGFALVGLGVLNLFRGLLVYGIWLILIGWFLYRAALAGYQHVWLRSLLEAATAEEVMGPAAPSVLVDRDLGHLLDGGVFERGVGLYPVEDSEGKLEGLIDLGRWGQVERARWRGVTLENVMTPVAELVCVGPDARLTDVLARLEESDGERALVVEGGRLRGVIGRAEIGRWLQRRKRAD